jgi:hypothetical protein
MHRIKHLFDKHRKPQEEVEYRAGPTIRINVVRHLSDDSIHTWESGAPPVLSASIRGGLPESTTAGWRWGDKIGVTPTDSQLQMGETIAR